MYVDGKQYLLAIMLGILWEKESEIDSKEQVSNKTDRLSIRTSNIYRQLLTGDNVGDMVGKRV